MSLTLEYRPLTALVSTGGSYRLIKEDIISAQLHLRQAVPSLVLAHLSVQLAGSLANTQHNDLELPSLNNAASIMLSETGIQTFNLTLVHMISPIMGTLPTLLPKEFSTFNFQAWASY